MRTDGSEWADRISAWAVGVGAGLIALMLTWLLGNRVASLLWDARMAATIAFLTAIVAGVLVSAVIAIRLDRSQRL